jgi:heme exporter protein D
MDALTEFFHMGGYAFYVWTSYAIAAFVMILNVFIPLRNSKAQKQRLQRAFASNESHRSQ